MGSERGPSQDLTVGYDQMERSAECVALGLEVHLPRVNVVPRMAGAVPGADRALTLQGVRTGG